ncbi:MAG: polyprenyl synthetase family protein [Thermoplasmata archaeon]
MEPDKDKHNNISIDNINASASPHSTGETKITLEEFSCQTSPYSEKVNRYLEKELVFEYKKIEEAARYYPLAAGKRLRPVLCMLSADMFFSGASDKILPFAASLEVIHNFTLIHDDIMDRDEYRRGHKTLHMVYGEAAAINTGDVLFAKGIEFALKTELPEPTVLKIGKRLARTVYEIGIGQQMDMDLSEMPLLPSPAPYAGPPGNKTPFAHHDWIEDIKAMYMRMIEKKTAVLFSTAAWAGGMAGSTVEGIKRADSVFVIDDKTIEALSEYGLCIGMAFQIWDDYLDYTSKTKERGKDSCSDLREGKKTYPILAALKNADDEQRKIIVDSFGKKGLTEKDVETVLKIIDITGGFRETERIAGEYVKKAKRHLEPLPSGREKDMLFALADITVSRKK